MIREAMLYEKMEGSNVRCFLCNHYCKIAPSKRGICGVRENKEGILYSLVYGSVIADHIDPIEKKPIFHLYPGSRSFSIATVGCNFRCDFCQNHEISQVSREEGHISGRSIMPEEIVKLALQSKSKSVSYTYTEPTIFFEFARDICRLARIEGIKNVFVTNGYMTKEAIDTLSLDLDAANVDLKSFRDDFYRRYCGARLQPVLDTLQHMKDLGIWIEITTLIIPSLNDGEDEIREIAQFVRSLGAETPWHVSRFHPQYRMLDRAPTNIRVIHRAVEIGKEAGLKYVYSGNMPGDRGENTYCHHCGNLLIGRVGYHVTELSLRGARCGNCGTALEGIFNDQ